MALQRDRRVVRHFGHMASVLVVDDEADLVELVRLTLDPDGYDVRVARDGMEALRALADDPPDIVILDIMLPGIDGFELLVRVRAGELAPQTRFIVMTCRTSERDHLRGFELGADDYLTKPFETDELTRRVAAVLAASPEELAAHREDELAKAAMLDRLEAVLRRPTRVGVGPA